MFVSLFAFLFGGVLNDFSMLLAKKVCDVLRGIYSVQVKEMKYLMKSSGSWCFHILCTIRFLYVIHTMFRLFLSCISCPKHVSSLVNVFRCKKLIDVL